MLKNLQPVKQRPGSEIQLIIRSRCVLLVCSPVWSLNIMVMKWSWFKSEVPVVFRGSLVQSSPSQNQLKYLTCIIGLWCRTGSQECSCQYRHIDVNHEGTQSLNLTNKQIYCCPDVSDETSPEPSIMSVKTSQRLHLDSHLLITDC